MFRRHKIVTELKMGGTGMFLSFKKRMLAVTVVVLTTVVLLETPWQSQTRWMVEYILDNPFTWDSCLKIFSRFP